MRNLISILLAVSLPWTGWSAPLEQSEEEPTPARVGVSGGKREISLADVIELALKNNLDVEIERTNIDTAKESLFGARSFLDPHFSFSPQIEDRSIPTSSTLIGTDGKLDQTIATFDAAWDQRLPWWGSSLRVALESTRETTTNPFEVLSPFNTARLGVSVTIPLSRNRKIDRARANLRITNHQVGLSEAQFKIKVIDVILRVQEAYWNLVAARQAVRVASEAVKLGREQLARTRRQIESGTLAPVELAAAQAELERRVDTWYASIGLVTQVENALKIEILASESDPMWDQELIPVDEETLQPPSYRSVREAVDIALRKRPELAVVDLREQTARVQEQLARDQAKTQVNLVGGYWVAGLSGVVVTRDNPFARSFAEQFQRVNELSKLAGLPPLEPPDFGTRAPANLVGGYGLAWEHVFRGSFPTALVGVQFDFSARNRSAKAELAKAAIAERRLKLERRKLEQAIAAQVRNALQAIQTARQRLTAAEASVRAAEEKLASEVRLFQTGESTNFLVLTRQNELSDSRRRAVVARLDFNKAVARAEQALGRTLEMHNIIIEPSGAIARK